METQVQQEYMNSTQEYVNNMDSTSGSQAIQKVESKVESAANEADHQLRVVSNKVSYYLAALPEYISSFYQQYKLPILAIGAFFAAIVAFKVIFAILDVFNGIPLMAPFLELVGIGYSVWFTNRYLLKAETRKELGDEISSFKTQILGG